MPNGISKSGDSAETLFLKATGFQKSTIAAAGDATTDVDGTPAYFEVKKATKSTINQVHAIKFIPLIVLNPMGPTWYVIPPLRQVQTALEKKRGQHNELALECMTMSRNQLSEFIVPEDKLAEQCCQEVRTAREYDGVKSVLEDLLANLRSLKIEYDRKTRGAWPG